MHMNLRLSLLDENKNNIIRIILCWYIALLRLILIGLEVLCIHDNERKGEVSGWRCWVGRCFGTSRRTEKMEFTGFLSSLCQLIHAHLLANSAHYIHRWVFLDVIVYVLDCIGSVSHVRDQTRKSLYAIPYYVIQMQCDQRTLW